MNDPDFFPELASMNFLILMKSAKDTLEKEGAQVCDGRDWLDEGVIRDAMHFHVRSTATVVNMYSEVMIKAQQESSGTGKFWRAMSGRKHQNSFTSYPKLM